MKENKIEKERSVFFSIVLPDTADAGILQSHTKSDTPNRNTDQEYD